jgi:hypothetical protein
MEKKEEHMADAPPVPSVKPKTPRWVKVLAIMAIVIVVLVVVVMKLSGGQHGPSRHVPGGGAETSSPSVVEDGGHTPPPGFDHGG